MSHTIWGGREWVMYKQSAGVIVHHRFAKIATRAYARAPSLSSRSSRTACRARSSRSSHCCLS